MPPALAVGRDKPRRSLPYSDVSLILDVLLDEVEGRSADCGDEVAVGPERRDSPPEAGVLGTKQPGGTAFDESDESGDPELRINADE